MVRSILRTALMKRPEARLPRTPLVYVIVLLSFVLLMGGGVFIYFALPRTAQGTSPTRADLLMQSVAIREGITLTTKYPGSQPQTKGGEMRFYLVTAKRPDGWQAQRIYIVQTQSSGCVQDAQNIDIPSQGAK